MAGISRSTTLVIAYIMTITELPWYDAMNAVREARKHANPNFGFQRQLQNFEYTTLKTVREELYQTMGEYDSQADVTHCKALLEAYKKRQEEIAMLTSNQQQVNCNPVRTYPLAFNAYNLDEEKKPVDVDTVRVELDSKKEETASMSTEEKEKEKEKVIESIFGSSSTK